MAGKRDGNGTFSVMDKGSTALRKAYHGAWKNDLKDVRRVVVVLFFPPGKVVYDISLASTTSFVK